MAPIALDRAYLTAIWLETLFYGINLSLFVSFIFITKYKRRGRRPLHKLILITAVLMFLLSSIHVSMGFQRLIRGFIELRDQPGGPAAFFSDVSIPANVAKVTIHTVNSILGDSIMVWRCYNVWGGNWLVVIWPVLFLMGSAVSGFGQSYIFAHGKTIHTAFNSQLARWNGSVFALSLATNALVTILIGARIWYLSRQYATLNIPSVIKYHRILLMIVESGSVYSSAVLIEITLYFLNNSAFYIVYDPIAQLTAIVPTTIIILTSLGLTSNELTTQDTYRASHTVDSHPQFAVGRGRGQGPISTMSMFSTAVPQDSTVLAKSEVDDQLEDEKIDVVVLSPLKEGSQTKHHGLESGEDSEKDEV